MRLVDLYWPVAQMVERLTVNQMVAGSSPAAATTALPFWAKRYYNSGGLMSGALINGADIHYR